MIKVFLKKVFSTSSESSSADDSLAVSEEQDGQPHSEPSGDQHQSDKDKWQPDPLFATITKEWIEKHYVKELEQIVRQLFEEASPNGLGYTRRFRIRLDESLAEEIEQDSFLGKRLTKYLHLCEREILDFTYFLDKQDVDTLFIYKTYLLPQNTEQLDKFLLERCMMLYETSESLAIDYQKEVESYFQDLGIPLDPAFFHQFEMWKEQVLRIQLEGGQHFKGEPGREQEEPKIEMLEISKEEVENENIQQIDQYMAKALESPEQAKLYRGTLLFSFCGFSKDADLLALMNRKDIKNWASTLVERHPYIFYFLNDDHYPMTPFLTSLIVTTEVEDDSVYFNEEELDDFKRYVKESLARLAEWLGDEPAPILSNFFKHFQ